MPLLALKMEGTMTKELWITTRNRMTPSRHPVRKQGLQSYIHMKLDFANNLNETESEFSFTEFTNNSPGQVTI
jgi:hypothetical protein